MTNNKIKMGVVGVGYLGEHHARIYSSMDQVELVGVADIDAGRADHIAAKYTTKAFHDYRELFGKAEAVSIAVPTVLHYPVALDFIRQNTDVLIEKPVTTTVEEAESLIREAAMRNVLVQVGHIERFNTAFRTLCTYLHHPRFIEAHRIGPYVGRGIDVDVILDLMIHDIDIILSIVKSELVDLRAVGIPVLTNHIDIANVRLEFADGCIANLTASRVSGEKMRKIRIFQSDTYISLDYGRQSMAIFRRIMENGIPKIVSEEISLEREEPLQVELTAFVEAVRNRTQPLVTGMDGIEALKIALRIIEDAKKRGIQ
ncbi:MAG: Gfo/Idh/MocA family oxidoreductase [Nitrospirae bacterium]|nr:Gfo/Idh/MocA family oxidoreductase [Nitrospirota bacterium]